MDIARLFKSKARSAIFRLYFTNHGVAYYLRELERMLKIPVSIIRKELMRLEREGLFLSEKKGNLVYYRINTDYPLFEELKSIVRKTIGVEGMLKDATLRIKGIKNAFIYGSFAGGKEKITSDIDLFIMGNINEDELVSKINSIEKSIRREINYTLFTPEEYKKKKQKKDAFIIDLLHNQRIMLKGNKNDL